jgi:hypothetical protein
MKTLNLFLFAVLLSLGSLAQQSSFEGKLIYGRKFYDNSKRIDSDDPNIPPIIGFTIKGKLILSEISTEKDFMTAMNYSIIIDSEKKEATMLARIANQQMAVKFDPSFFSKEQLYTIVPASKSADKIIAGLNCKQGYALKQSEFGTTDSMLVWYTLQYSNIPYLFQSIEAPGLIVSMQQDADSYWELKEINKSKIDADIFNISKEFKPMTQVELQNFITSIEQLEIEKEQDPMDQRGNEINREKEED